MSANYEQLLDAIKEVADFAQRTGVKKQAAAFEKLYRKLRANKRSSKSLEDEVFTARGLAAYWIPAHISKQAWDPAKRQQADAEFSRLKQALDDALMPPKSPAFPETEIQGLIGNESTKVFGDPKDAKIIAARTVEVVSRFSDAVFKRDIETAYGLCANELRTWMSVKRFFTELEKADRDFGGRAVECKIERGSILADEVARKKTSQGSWPKDTPKSNRRATVGAFWFTDPKTNQGRWVMFCVTEEAEGYRIAKFHQYVQ